MALRDMGLVAQVFTEEKLRGLRRSGRHRAHPVLDDRRDDVDERAAERPARRRAGGRDRPQRQPHEHGRAARASSSPPVHGSRSTSDTEVIAALIARDERAARGGVARAMERSEGAYSIVLLSEGKLVGFRDADGIRPLALGRLDGDWLMASESCAFDLLGAELVREIKPGEVVIVDGDGLRSIQALEPKGDGAGCIFEFIYFARPDSRPRRRRAQRRARADGRAACRGGSGRGRPRRADPRLGHACRDRLRPPRAGSPTAKA